MAPSILDPSPHVASADEKDLERARAIRAQPVRLAFERQQQCHSNWCWAAVTASISAYYDESSSFTQCAIANMELKRFDCCNSKCHDPSVEFNVMHVLGAPLNRVGCLDCCIRKGAASREQIMRELAAGRPICARIIWPDASGRADGRNGGHFVTIIGFDPTSDRLTIADPWTGMKDDVGYNQLKCSYGTLGGKWNDTYFTRKPEAEAVA